MRLRQHPRTPTGAAWLIVSAGAVPEAWSPYLAVRFADAEKVAAAG